MSYQSTFVRSCEDELPRLNASGFTKRRDSKGDGFYAIAVFRGPEFINIVLDTHDEVVYAELGRQVRGRMPGWRRGERIDLRQLKGVPRDLGMFNSVEEAIPDSVRKVVEEVLRHGLGHFEGRSPESC